MCSWYSNGEVEEIYTLPEKLRSHLKMDGWKTIVSYWDGFLAGVMLVPRTVYLHIYIYIHIQEKIDAHIKYVSM